MASLGPKPRMGGLGQQDQGLEFYNAGAAQPSFSSPGAGVQPPSFQQPAAPGGPGLGVAQQPQFVNSTAGSMQSGSMQPGVFTPQVSQVSTPGGYDDDFENEPPLLEELGIDVGSIWLRMKGIAFFKPLDEETLRDADLSGPFLIILALGLCLLLGGKLVLGLLYGWGSMSCIFICLLINVMSQRGGIDLYRTMSILGYGLIPIVLLAFIGIFLSLKSSFGSVISMLCIGWATATSSRFFATAIAMHQQRWLVAYPVGLVYTLVTLITVF